MGASRPALSSLICKSNAGQPIVGLCVSYASQMGASCPALPSLICKSNAGEPIVGLCGLCRVGLNGQQAKILSQSGTFSCGPVDLPAWPALSSLSFIQPFYSIFLSMHLNSAM